MHKITVAVVVFWGIHACVAAQNANMFAGNKMQTLQSFIDSAYQNSAVIKDNQNKLSYSGLNLKQTLAEVSGPKIFVASEVLLAPYVNNGRDVFTPYPADKAIGYDAAVTNGGLYSATANATVPLFTAANKKAYRQLSTAETEAYTNQIELTKHELEQQVTGQYVQCYLSELQMDYQQKAIALLEDEKLVVKNLVVSGLDKQSDYMLMGIEIQTQKILWSQYRTDYTTSLLQLKTLCGINDTAVVMIAAPEIEVRQLNEQSKFLKIYRTDSLQIMASQNIFNLKYKPSLNLYANGGLNAVELPGIQKKFGLSAGLTFNWMLYDGKQKKLEQQKNALLLNTSQNYRTGFLKQHELQKQNALKEISNINGMIAQKAQQLTDYGKLLQVYKLQLAQGQISVTDYLNTVRSYNDLQRDIALAGINKLQVINEYNYLNW